jgi:hypothetical protein
MCERIILYIENPTVASTTAPTKTNNNNKKVDAEPAVNLTCLVNVMFGEVIWPELHKRACNFTKEDLTQGLTTGQSRI